MPEALYSHILYDREFSLSSISTLLEAYGTAAESNWREFRDEWSTLDLDPPLDIAYWLDLCKPERMMFCDWKSGSSWWQTEEGGIAFSPLSTRCAGMILQKMSDSCLGVNWYVSNGIQWETQGDRELLRQGEHWAHIRMERGEPAPQSRNPIVGHPEFAGLAARGNYLAALPTVGPQNLTCARRLVRALLAASPATETKIHKLLL